VSLGYRLLVLVLVAAVPVFVLQISREVTLRASRAAEIDDNAVTIGRLVAARQNRLIEGVRAILTAAAQLDSVRTLESEACGHDLQLIAAPFPEITGISAIAPSGDAVCSSAAEFRPINIADRDYFQRTMQTKAFQASGFIIGRQTGRGSIAFTYPQLDAEGDVLMITLVAISSDTMSQTFAEVPLPEGAFVALIDGSGVVAGSWPNPEAWVGRDLPGLPLAAAAGQIPTGALRIRVDNEVHAVSLVPLARAANLIVAVGLPLAPAAQANQTIFQREIGVTIGIFLFAAAAALLGAHFWVRRPIVRLTRTADAITQGHLDARPEKVASVPEIAALREGLDAMAVALEKRQSELMSALGQKELLLREMNHRVKNSLQLVASIVGLQTQRIADPRVRETFEEASRQIAVIARVHQRLYRDEKVDSVAFGAFLEEMCEELKVVLGVDDATIACEAEPFRLPIDQAIPLGLIANELITNAYKYARPPAGEKNLISVSSRREGSDVVLSVADGGGPLPNGPGQTDGFGMRMIGALVAQLRGRLEVEERRLGKAIVVHLPVEIAPIAA
jgi:two-component sensor histidine kinase